MTQHHEGWSTTTGTNTRALLRVTFSLGFASFVQETSMFRAWGLGEPQRIKNHVFGDSNKMKWQSNV